MTTSTKEAAARAASATLAGALAVGMVPAAALAAEAPEAEAGDGIEALTASVADEYANAKISQVKLNGGAAQATPTGKIEIAKDTPNLAVLPTQLTSVKTGNTLDVLDKDGEIVTGLVVKYFDAEGSETDDVTAIGTYTVQVVSAGDKITVGGEQVDNPYAGLSSAKISFSVVGKSLAGATLYEVNDKNLSDVSDTVFTYNGGVQAIGVALDGAPLPKKGDVQQYTVKYYKADGVTSVDNDAIINAGDYIAVVKGTEDYAGSETQIKFTVGQLDLSKADIVVNDIVLQANQNATTTLASVNGIVDSADPLVTNVATIQNLLDFTYPVVPTQTGSYQVSIAPKAVAAGNPVNIIGSKTLSYNVVKSASIYVAYGSDAFGNKEVNLSAGDSYSTSAIKVYEGDDAQGTPLTADQYTVTVTDKDGNAVDASKLSTPGKWTVTVAVNSKAMDYALGGKRTATVTVTNGTIAANDIFVTYKGKAASSFTKTYTGVDYLKDVAVKVAAGDKSLVEGTDYKVTYTNSKGEEVKEFTNADAYKVTVTSDTWKIQGVDTSSNVCVFTIRSLAINTGDLKIANQVKIPDGVTKNEKGEEVQLYAEGIPYTGSDITPAFQYATVDEDGKAVEKDGKAVLADLPASAYKITKITKTVDGEDKEVKAVKEAGTYKVTIVDADDKDNFVVSGDPVEVKVVDNKVFQDVPADAWYAQVVTDAAEAKIMNGYSGTNLFGPNDQITRGQVACVLFNMAGGAAGGKDDNQVNDFTGYPSFKDVDSHAYYAQAIAWAKDAKIVNGYDDGTFRPDQNVTREEFACMLWNYAKANLSSTVKDIDVATALASKPDGAKVSGWAKEGVAWAVQNKIMGNGGVITPAGKVTRAETAAMAMNYIGLNK